MCANKKEGQTKVDELIEKLDRLTAAIEKSTAAKDDRRFLVAKFKYLLNNAIASPNVVLQKSGQPTFMEDIRKTARGLEGPNGVTLSSIPVIRRYFRLGTTALAPEPAAPRYTNPPACSAETRDRGSRLRVNFQL